MTSTGILVIDDDPRMLEGLGKLLRQDGWRVALAADGATGLRALREEPVQVVLTDLKMPGLDGLAVLREVKDAGLEAEVVLLTGHGSIDAAVQAMKDGAFDFLTKPPDTERLLRVLRRAAERRALLRRTQALEAAAGDGRERALIAESPAMKRLLALVDQAAPTDATVLITGETGTGKELLARRLHALSPRRDQPFITVNCAAIPEHLLESELFGYEKGAFTGAIRRKPGRFELADGGTLFLDEVAELAPAAQAKLLRVLQEREVERLGGTRPIPVDTRILAASNQDLLKLVKERAFREDLYYRLNVVTINVPALRDRSEDVLTLALHFLTLHARQQRRSLSSIAPDAAALLRQHRWPGNIRELEHALQRAVVLARGVEVTAADLALQSDDSALAAHGLPERATLAELEKHWILTTVARHGGNQRDAAAALGIDRSTLHRKLRTYGTSSRPLDQP
jgi:two-component system response regulator HydG